MTDKTTFLVTGGAGFIGSHFVDYACAKGHKIVVLDKLTYAGNRDNLDDAEKIGNVVFAQGDINDLKLVNQLLQHYQVGAVFHLAAESHVDNSISDADIFVQTNIAGTASLLKACHYYWHHYWQTSGQQDFRFIHISTDEVFGTLSEADLPFSETAPYQPNSPYSASKAASDHLVRAWFHTYQFPTIVTNCSNNYGTRQHAEKLIPTIIRKALAGEAIPIYGNGQNIRDWLHVKDHCIGLYLAYQKGNIGESYCFGGSNEWRNLDLAKKLCMALDKMFPKSDGSEYQEQIEFVEDRKGHDWRYAIDSRKAEQELGFMAEEQHDDYLQEVIKFYHSFYQRKRNTQQENTQQENLPTVKKIDFETIKFSYETHEQLAKNPHITGYERVGFPSHYREGRDEFIVTDIINKLEFTNKSNGSFLDIGCGASPLTTLLLEKCHDYHINPVLNDSAEMLACVESKRPYQQVVGRFPQIWDDCMKKSPLGYDMILSYSVLQLVHTDGNIFDFLNAIISALKIGGYALIGDIPNQSKRKRFFSSDTGIAFHKEFMNTNQAPTLQYGQVERGMIDDTILQALINHAQLAGCNAYLVPQAENLPFANRRDDLIIRKL